MNKQLIRVGLSMTAVAVALVPAVFMQQACLSAPADAGAASSSSSSSGGSSGSGATSGDGAAAVSCTTLPSMGSVPSACVIDDMTNVATETGGYWYTYSDRTIPNTADVVDGSLTIPVSCSGGAGSCVVATSDGMINPAEGAAFPPSTDMTDGPMVNGMTQAFREFTGSGLTLWGAGMGFNWGNSVPDAGTSDAADAAAVLGVPIAFDASAHSGIAFWGKSNTASSTTVGVHFSDDRIAAAAGECDASVYFNSPVECGDDYFKNFTFTTTWQQFKVVFSSLTTQNYSGMKLLKGGLHLDKMYQVHFQVNNAAFMGAGAVMGDAPFDISVAYITWYDGM